MPKQINIEEAKDGMVLAMGVEDKAGRPILKAGDVIKAVFIERLKKWGVDHITIESEEGDDDEMDYEDAEGGLAFDEKSIDAMLASKFRFHKADSHMIIVKKSAKKIFMNDYPRF